MEKKSKKKNLGLISVIIIVAISIVVLGATSYGLWVVTKHQESTNTITTSCFEVEFTELSSAINLTNAYPITDEKGLKTTPYTFKVKNICDTKTSYKITLNTLKISGNKIPDNLIKYVFYDSSSTVSVGSYLSNATINTETDNIETTLPIITSYEMASGTLEKDKSKQYMLKLWIDESATTAINGYRFESSINVISTPTN